MPQYAGRCCRPDATRRSPADRLRNRLAACASTSAPASSGGDRRGVRAAAARGRDRVYGGEGSGGIALSHRLAQRVLVRSRRGCRPAEQPQLPPAALVLQQASFSLGSQHAPWTEGAQQPEAETSASVVSEEVSSAMRSVPPARVGDREPGLGSNGTARFSVVLLYCPSSSFAGRTPDFDPVAHVSGVHRTLR